MAFVHPIEGCMTTGPNVPEFAIAYKEADVLDLYSTTRN